MNILILNWRDPDNPRSGGAEAVTYKYASYWSSLGHQVFWISNSFSSSVGQNQKGDINFIRIPPKLGYTVVGLVFSFPLFLINAVWTAIRLSKRIHFDLVIDEIHGFPFFTPLYLKGRKVLLVCEVAGTIWDKMFPFPVNIVGQFLERQFLLMYKNTETWAISHSTANDLYHVNHNRAIKVLPLGINPPPRVSYKKFPHPSAVFLGRLVRMKGVESAIYAAGRIRQDFPDFKLYVVGAGSTEYLNFLKNKAKELKAQDNVVFCGYISDGEKIQLLSQSHFLIHPSYKEGFGLTVLEAASVGTPTIARKESSLDELIIDQITGYLFSDDSEISTYFKKGLSRTTYSKMCKLAIKNSRKYHWSTVLKKSSPITDL